MTQQRITTMKASLVYQGRCGKLHGGQMQDKMKRQGEKEQKK
jgi:hypothetical protein